MIRDPVQRAEHRAAVALPVLVEDSHRDEDGALGHAARRAHGGRGDVGPVARFIFDGSAASCAVADKVPARFGPNRGRREVLVREPHAGVEDVDVDPFTAKALGRGEVSVQSRSVDSVEVPLPGHQVSLRVPASTLSPRGGDDVLRLKRCRRKVRLDEFDVVVEPFAELV